MVIFCHFFRYFFLRDSVKFKNKLRTIEPHFLKKIKNNPASFWKKNGSSKKKRVTLCANGNDTWFSLALRETHNEVYLRVMPLSTKTATTITTIIECSVLSIAYLSTVLWVHEANELRTMCYRHVFYIIRYGRCFRENKRCLFNTFCREAVPRFLALPFLITYHM